MGFLERLRKSSKDALLGTLHEQLRQLALEELASGKLKSPADLDEVCARILPSLRGNPLTGGMLKTLKVEDSELKEVLREVFVEVGVEVHESC